MEIDRRAFMCRAAEALAAVALSGCASVAATRVAATNGTIRLPLDGYPALRQPGGFLQLQPEGARGAIYLLATGEDEFVALSPICTHQGCTVGIQGDRLVCPCHGSTYDRSGQVLRGPAERPLLRYGTSLTRDGTLVIQLEESS